jgi:hypothetical protein
MATAEQLRELLPPTEPPAGFETRVLERLGLPAPAGQYGRDGQYSRDGQNGQDEHDKQGARDARPLRAPAPKDGPRHRRAGGDTARPGVSQSRGPSAGPGGARRPGRMRRVLAAAAVSLAVIAAGLGGWRIGAGPEPAESQLAAASLVSVTSQHVGQVFYYSGSPGWLYMSVDMGSGSGMVTCEVIGADGRVTTIGSFQLADGYGAWGSPDPGYLGPLTGARLVSATGTVLASGTFHST